MGCVRINLSSVVTGSEELESELESEVSSLMPLSRSCAWHIEKSYADLVLSQIIGLKLTFKEFN